MNDKATIQAQLDQLVADEKVLESGITQRADLIQKHNAEIQKHSTEIEQHRGALAYNHTLAEGCRRRLTELAAAATATPTQ